MMSLQALFAFHQNAVYFLANCVLIRVWKWNPLAIHRRRRTVQAVHWTAQDKQCVNLGADSSADLIYWFKLVCLSISPISPLLVTLRSHDSLSQSQPQTATPPTTSRDVRGRKSNPLSSAGEPRRESKFVFEVDTFADIFARPRPLLHPLQTLVHCCCYCALSFTFNADRERTALPHSLTLSGCVALFSLVQWFK